MDKEQVRENRFRALFDGIPVGLYRSTPDGRILDANATFVELIGAPDRETLRAARTSDLYDDPRDQQEWRRRMAREGVVRGFVARCRRFYGGTIWVEETSRAVRDETGEVSYYDGAVSDITDQVHAEEQLAASEALLLAAVEQSPAGVLIADAPDVNIRMANSAALGIRGESETPLTEIPADIHPENWQVYRPDGTLCAPEELPLTRAVQRGETVRDEEYIIRRKDGESRWVLANAGPVRDTEGNIVAGVVVFPDITERKRSVTILERREAVLDAVGFAAGCFLTAPNWEHNIQEVLTRLGRAVEASRAYLFEAREVDDTSFTASQRFEWVAEGVKAFLDDESMQGMDLQETGLQRWGELLLANDVVSGHLREFPESEQWLIEEQDIRSILLVPVFAGERIWGLMGFDECAQERDWSIAEVEALRTAARTLGAAILRNDAEAERARLAAAVGQVADSIVITNRKGTIQYVNSAFERTTGYSAEEAIGQNPRMLKSGLHDAEYYGDMWSVITAGRTWRGRLVNRRKDESLFEEEATISPLRNADGEIVSFVGVKKDVTEQSLLERQLRHAQRMESLGRLAGGIAHDFNNVMGQVLGAAELLKKYASDERALDYVDLILEAVNRGKNITERMLGFSRDEEGRVQAMSAVGLLDSLIEVGKHTFPKGVTIRRSLQDEEMYARCDGAQILKQALMNLCINAVDAMPAGGTLTLGYRPATRNEVKRELPDQDGDYICLTVGDSGTGMDKRVLERIFLPFYTQKPVGKGTGLGLYIVYGIARAHGGWVGVESKPGRGTVVSIGLPAAEKPVKPTREEAHEAHANGDGRRILVVDDELGLLILLTEVLEGEEYKVTCATDGREAIRILDTADPPPDLVITDIGMPNMGGRELIENLRANMPEMRIVVASGYMDAEEHGALRNLGVDAVLTKPFQMDQVLETVAEVLEAR